MDFADTGRSRHLVCPCRSEFRVWHEDDQCYYIMFDKVSKFRQQDKGILLSQGY